MANSISQKLRIKKKYRLLTLNAPANLKKGLQELPAEIKLLKQRMTMTRCICL